MNGFQIIQAGDSTLVVEFEERIDASINARAVAVADALTAAALSGVRDVVPTYRSVAVYFDPLRTDGDALLSRLEREAGRATGASASIEQPILIPICYGGDFGPDLSAVAAFGGLGESDVVQLHAKAVYRVFMLGFIPGFAYLGTVDARIAAPRRAEPRVRVPAGSVGIAGGQTGIYSLDSPGGWQLVGRTPRKLFDVTLNDPCVLRAGCSVQFHPVDRREYDRLNAAS